MALTETNIKTLTLDGGRRELLMADVNGLYIRLRAGKGAVTKSWQWRRKDGGKLLVKALGPWPDLSLKQARLKAAELAAQRGNVLSPTFEKASAQWLEEVIEPSHKGAAGIRGHMRRAVRELGRKRLADIAPRDLVKLVRDVREEAAQDKRARAGGRGSASNMLAALKTLFSHSVAMGWIETSPAVQITEKVIGATLQSRSRVLTDDEILFVLKSEAPQAPIWRFLLATGLRISEAYNGHRDGDCWVVPPEASKNTEPHRVWLSPIACQQLDDAWPWLPKWQAQLVLSTMKVGWSCHDLRRTFSTRMNGQIKAAPYVVEKMLNHSLGGVMAIYNRAAYLDERRDALEAWSTWLLALDEAPSAEVVPLRARAL